MLSRFHLPCPTPVRRYLKADLRCFLRTTSVAHKLIGPPDPISNLRPVIYDEDVPAALAQAVKTEAGVEDGGKRTKEETYMLPAVQIPKTSPTHPYLLDEFDGDPVDYQWRTERKRIDAFNHTFWTDSNARFEAAKASVLSALPETASSRDREIALSEFYGQWVKQEEGRLTNYADKWNRQNWNNVFLEVRSTLRRLRSRIFGDSGASRTYYPPTGSSKSKEKERS